MLTLFPFLLALFFYAVIAVAVWKLFAMSKEIDDIKRMLREIRDRLEQNQG